MKRRTALLFAALSLVVLGPLGCAEPGGDGGGSSAAARGAGTGAGAGTEGTEGDGTEGDSAADGSVGGGAASDATGAGEPEVQPETEPEPASSCNPLKDEGCTEGETCSFSPTGTSPECVVAGVVPIGGSCEGGEACAEGVCLQLEGTSGPLCYKFCKIQGHCGVDACVELESSPYSVCELEQVEHPPCTLLDVGACGVGQGCFIVGGQDGPVCRGSGGAPEDGACANPTDCADGLACVNSICKRLCDSADADPCDDPFVACSSYWGAIGYCDR